MALRTLTFLLLTFLHFSLFGQKILLTQSSTSPNNETCFDFHLTGGTLDCSTSEISLRIQTVEAHLQYQWLGPNGFKSTQSNPTVNKPGEYMVTATNPKNGCQVTKKVAVFDDKKKYETNLDDITLDSEHPSINLPSFVENYEVTWTSPKGELVSDDIDEVGEYLGHFMIGKGCEGIAKLTIDSDYNESEMPNKAIVASSIKPIISLTNFKVTPNPNTGIFTIQLDFKSPTNFNIHLISLLGNEVYHSQNPKQISFEKTIDVSELSAGTYFLKIDSNGDQVVKKIIILD